MRDLRWKRAGGKLALQTPLIAVEHRDGQRGLLVLTSHLGEPGYFGYLRDRIAAAGSPVFFEGVRSADEAAEHWREPYHRLLRAIRSGLYEQLAALDILAFQGRCLPPQPGWVNADVDCCRLAARLQERHVSTRPYELGLRLLEKVARDAAAGNREARRTLERTIKWGLLAVSVGFVFEASRLIPNNRRFQQVINDWRSAVAVRTVLEQQPERFVLIYGAAHGRPIMRALARAGFRESGREWATVYRL